jgi:phenylalanyl-tRNA synthetase beta chain
VKISYNWLKKFIDFEFDPQELASVLTSMGTETYVISRECCWSNVVTVKVLDVQKHPFANRLFLCKVTDGLNNYSIVCGADNVSSEQIVPLAKIGAVLPGGVKIKKSKIRGKDSEGMICSESELGLKKKSKGILVLDKNTKIGVALEDILRSNSILEIEVMINRGDCLSHLGIAREIGAKIRKIPSLPKIKTFNVPSLNCVEVAPDLCLRYIGMLISGVRIGPSPAWIINALEENGIKSVNNVVDITNYVMIELGQPLHVFDIKKLGTEMIFVRRARNDETIIALNDREYKLDSETIVVANDEKPVAIAGIMGGKYFSVDEKTVDVFLESAIFNADLIRKTSKKLSLTSDSSYRFERGLGWGISDLASWRAANLITEIAGGIIKSKQDLQTIKYEMPNICLRFERISKILGCDVKKDETIEILKFLGVNLQLKNEMALCTIPSWRNDIKIEVDLIEEIARIKGYDVISTSLIHEENDTITISSSNNSFLPAIVEDFRFKLNGLGFSEVLNYSFLEIDKLKKFGLKYSHKITNPISKENEILRPSLLPALYKNLLLNVSYGCERVVFFEYGKVFTEYGEQKTFAIIMCGKIWGEWWKWLEQGIIPKYDFYFGAGVVKNILPSNEFKITENLNPEGYYHPGKTASVVFEEKSIGQFGILNPIITTDDIKEDVFYFEINLDLFDSVCFKKKSFYKTYSKLPMVKRDISIVAKRDLQFLEIEKIIKIFMRDDNILKKYSLFSVYSYESKFGNNKISYSLRLFYKNDEKTLTDKEVNENMRTLLHKLYVELGVELRQ